MAAHHAPGIHFQTFLLDAVGEAGYEDVFVLPADKHIDPVDGAERNEVKLLLVPDFVAAAHGGKVGSLHEEKPHAALALNLREGGDYSQRGLLFTCTSL